MDGLSVAEDKAATGKVENGEFCSTSSQVHAQHRRSKSASEKKLDVLRDGALHSKRKDRESHELPLSSKTTTQDDQPIDINSDVSSNLKASLEEDIEQLQLRLQQEKLMRILLERAMGRASSSLSPGHRHFAAQTKELITEIELLEEEVANREQHVLSLYRSIFDHCASRTPSEQSSSVASPAHTKLNSKKQKHPSIISSAFCSSKKFPLRSFQASVSTNESGTRASLAQSKSRHGSVLSKNMNIQFEKIYSEHAKGHEKGSTAEKAAVMRTLKDHLHQCPSKLSEEMVRCMATVYCGLRGSASTNPEKNRSPLLSRSSTSVILPQPGIVEDRGCSCKSMVEISCISTDKNQFSRASYAINNYRFLVEQLEKVKVKQMESNAQTAFWVNVYNSLIMHAYLAYGIPHSSLRRLALFHKAAYNIGGHVISATAIEHSIFGFRTPRMGRWLETILSTAMRKKYGEEKPVISSKFGLPTSEPLVCFALCTGAFSDPMLKVYTSANIKDELHAAKKEFLLANVVVKKTKNVFLSKVLERFSKEASIRGSDDLLKWVIDNVDKKLRDSIQKCFDRKRNMKASQIIEWTPYSSRFRYVFSKDLTEKPWWG